MVEGKLIAARLIVEINPYVEERTTRVPRAAFNLSSDSNHSIDGLQIFLVNADCTSDNSTNFSRFSESLRQGFIGSSLVILAESDKSS